MHILPMALMAAGKIVQGVGQLKAGNAAKNAAFAQAQEAENAGAAQELRIRDSARKAIGEQLASQFGNGMMGGSGSALDALTESQVNAAMDALQVRRDVAMRAASLRASGKQAQSEGRWGMAGSLLGAASSALGMKEDWAQARSGSSASGSTGSSTGGNYDPKTQF